MTRLRPKNGEVSERSVAADSLERVPFFPGQSSRKLVLLHSFLSF